MSLDFITLYSVILILLSGSAIGLVLYLQRGRADQGQGLVQVLLLLNAWFAVSYVFESGATSVEARLLWIKLEYPAIVFLMPAFLMFALRLGGYGHLIKRPMMAALMLVPILVIAAVWTTPAHPWFYSSFGFNSIQGQMVWQVIYGPFYWLYLLYSIGLYVFSLSILFLHVLKPFNPLRRQMIVFLGLFALIGVATVLYISRISPFHLDYSPLMSLISALVVAVSSLRTSIFTFSPIALETLLKSMVDGVILLNVRGQIVDLNAAAQQLLGLTRVQAVGQTLATAWPSLSVAMEANPNADSKPRLFFPQVDGKARAYEFAASGVGEIPGQSQGMLLLVRDVDQDFCSRRQLQERDAELTKARSFLEKVVSTVPMGISIYDLSRQSIEFHNRSHTTGGRSIEEYNRLNLQERGALMVAEDVAHFDGISAQLADLQDGDLKIIEFRRHQDQNQVWTRMYFSVFQRDAHHRVEKILVMSEDITPYKQTLLDLAQSETRYRSLFEGLTIGLYRSTPQGDLLNANDALVNLLGYPDRESLLARNVNDLYYDPAERPRQLERIGKFEGERSLPYDEIQLQRWDGEVIWVKDTPHLTLDPEGLPVFEGSIEDISRRKKIEKELQASEEKFRNIFDLSPNSVLLIDQAGMIVDCNQNTLRLHGFVSKEEVNHRPLAEFVVVDDRARLQELIRASVEENGQQGVALSLVGANGSSFPVEVATSMIPDLGGGPKMMIVTVMDVTARKEVEDNLHETQAQLAQRVQELELRTQQILQLTEMSNMLQICRSLNEAYSFVEYHAARLFPGVAGVLMMWDREQQRFFCQARWGQLLVDPRAIDREDCWALRSGQPYLCVESGACLCHHSIGQRQGGTVCVPISSDGIALGVVNLMAEDAHTSLGESHAQLALAMSEQVGLALSNLQLRENLHEQAIRDPLTGLYNRYYLREALETEISRARTSMSTVSVVMIDLDHFKAFNTRYGHLNVDTLLGEFGKLAHSFVQNGEIVLRYGGDEFVLILPGATLQQAAQRAEQFKRKVRQLVVYVGDQSIQNVTLSIGIAGWPMHGVTFTELLKAADKALFRAKEVRDHIIIAD